MIVGAYCRARPDEMDRVLILDGNQRSALAATRTLGQKGLHVTVAEEGERSLAGSSKYCKEHFPYPSPYRDPTSFVAALKKAIRERSIKVLFPMTELSTYLVLKHRHEFADTHIPSASFERFDSLTNKHTLIELARELRIPIPVTHLVLRREELPRLYAHLQFPVVLKPYRSRAWTKDRWTSASVSYASSIEEITAVTETIEFFKHHPFLLQEYFLCQRRRVSRRY